MNKSEVYVSVIIPTYHDWKRLALCLEALNLQFLSKDQFEIIIVNNAPNDQNEFIFSDNCTYLVESKPGSYAARNAGITIAKGNILAFTDSDCIPERDWLTNAISYFEQNPNIFRIAGNIMLFPVDEHRLTEVEIFDMTFGFPQRRYAARGGGVTGNMIAKREVFDKVGLFNDELFSGGDLEWGKRALDMGYRIEYVSKVRVNHPARNEWKDIETKHKRFAGGIYKLNKEKIPFSYYFKEMFRPLKSFIYVLKNNERNIKFNHLLLAMKVNYKLIKVRFNELKRLKHNGVAERK